MRTVCSVRGLQPPSEGFRELRSHVRPRGRRADAGDVRLEACQPGPGSLTARRGPGAGRVTAATRAPHSSVVFSGSQSQGHPLWSASDLHDSLPRHAGVAGVCPSPCAQAGSASWRAISGSASRRTLTCHTAAAGRGTSEGLGSGRGPAVRGARGWRMGRPE